MRSRLLGPAVVALCGVACIPAPESCPDAAALGLDPSAILDPTLPDPRFMLGVEYIQSGLEDTYAATGVRWAKTRLEAFDWQSVEPRAPVGDEHTDDWRCSDAQIGLWQQAGITQIQAYLSPRSRWGSVGLKDYAPKPLRRDDHRRWVRALIERYDGDGVDDMPGLRRPVRHWVMGGEWTGFWPSDDAAGYLDWLEMTVEEARDVFPQVHVGLIPFFVSDAFDGNEPDDASIETELADPPPGHRNSTAGMLAILERTDLYDSLSLHSLGDYTEIPPMLRWFRAHMEERGARRPIVFDDAFPIGLLANESWEPLHPVTARQKEAVLAALDAVTAGDAEAVAWLRRLTARGVVHKAATALGEGALGIQIGNTEDWTGTGALNTRQATVDLIGAAAHFGMTDVEWPDGLGLGAVRVPGAARPALGALELASRWLRDDTVVVGTVGGLTGIRGYAFENEGAPFWIVWSEDGLLQLPGEEESVAMFSVQLPAGATRARVTNTPEASAAIESVEVEAPAGALVLSVGEHPVVVEAL